MSLQTLIQLHIMLAMTTAMTGWMVVTPGHTILVRAFESASQSRCVSPARRRMGWSTNQRRFALSAVRSTERRQERRFASADRIRPSHVDLPSSIVTFSSFVRAP
jgi:hypothetical protein